MIKNQRRAYGGVLSFIGHKIAGVATPRTSRHRVDNPEPESTSLLDVSRLRIESLDWLDPKEYFQIIPLQSSFSTFADDHDHD